jgi:hypothetical protein
VTHPDTALSQRYYSLITALSQPYHLLELAVVTPYGGRRMFLKRGHEGLDFLPGRGALGFEEVLGPTVLGLGLTVRYSATVRRSAGLGVAPRHPLLVQEHVRPRVDVPMVHEAMLGPGLNRAATRGGETQGVSHGELHRVLPARGRLKPSDATCGEGEAGRAVSSSLFSREGMGD